MTERKTEHLRDIITKIASRALMYLRERSFRDLNVYLTGYCHGIDSTLPGATSSYDELGAFGDWLRRRFGATPRMEWGDVLLAEHNGDDKAAFESFFLLWNEFLIERL